MTKKKSIIALVNSAEKCYYCELTFGSDNHAINAGIKTRDHIIPLAKLGKDIPENIVIACRWCNEEKGNMTLVKFFDHILAMKSLAHLQRDKDIILENIASLIQQIDPYYYRLSYKNHEVNRLKFSNTKVRKTPKKSSLVGDYLKRHKYEAADVRFSVNDNTSRLKPKQDILYLQNQTPEQFREKRRIDQIVKQQLSLPKPNFHERD